MHRRTWQKFEQAVARFFGCQRSGPMQSKDANDIDHDTLHVQCKHGKRHAIISVWDAAKLVADKDGKIPCVAIRQTGRKGWWLLVKADDLTAVANQRSIAKQEGE